jgi:hypothetical protein
MVVRSFTDNRIASHDNSHIAHKELPKRLEQELSSSLMFSLFFVLYVRYNLASSHKLLNMHSHSP